MRPLHSDEIILLQFLIKSSQLKNEFFNDDPAPIFVRNFYVLKNFIHENRCWIIFVSRT